MFGYKKRSRPDRFSDRDKKSSSRNETELVLKIGKDDLFDPYVLLPHSELNSAVSDSVDTFVEKYTGDEMTLSIFTDEVSPETQTVFREVYRSHYEDELRKVNRFLYRHYNRVVILLVVCVVAFFISARMAAVNPEETISSYVIANVSCFCLWEVGYTQFETRDVLDEQKRITRAMNAKIEFQ